MIPRTSKSDPLIIDPVRPGSSTGLIGMTFCPGKTDPYAKFAAWERDINLDLNAITEWGATAVVSLMTEAEFHHLKVPVSTFKEGLKSRGLKWFHLPIQDGEAPDDKFKFEWDTRVRNEIHEILDGGRSLIVHCRGGVGRTGTIAAQLLIEYGCDPEDAIAQVRQSRKDTIETPVQEEYVRSLVPGETPTEFDVRQNPLPRCPVCGTDKISAVTGERFEEFLEVAEHIASEAVEGERRHMVWARERYDGPNFTRSTINEYVTALTEIVRIEQPVPAETPAGELDEIQLKIEIAAAAITVERRLSAYIRNVLISHYGRSNLDWWVTINKTIRDKCNSRMEDCDYREHPYFYADLIDSRKMMDNDWKLFGDAGGEIGQEGKKKRKRNL